MRDTILKEEIVDIFVRSKHGELFIENNDRAFGIRWSLGHWFVAVRTVSKIGLTKALFLTCK